MNDHQYRSENLATICNNQLPPWGDWARRFERDLSHTDTKNAYLMWCFGASLRRVIDKLCEGWG